MFGYDTYESDEILKDMLRRYSNSQRAIEVDFRKLVPFLANADRATHLLHPYPAKLLVHIPFFFLSNSILSKPGDIIGDPFCGSGTVLLESQLSGRRAVGADCNPLARLLTTVKTRPIPKTILTTSYRRLVDRIPSETSNGRPDVVNLDHWFYPHVVRQLQCLKDSVDSTRRQDVREFFQVCFSNCVRRVSLADPRLSVPVRLKEGQYPVNHPLRQKTDAHLRRLRRINVFKVFEEVVASNCKRIAALEEISSSLPTTAFVSNDVREIPRHDHFASTNGKSYTGSLQLVITSPPYPGAQKYIRSSSLSLGWLDLCASSELIGHKLATIGREEFRKAEYSQYASSGLPSADRVLGDLHSSNPVRATIAATYLKEMRSAIEEIWSQLRSGGYLVLIAANNQIAGREFKTQRYLQQIAEKTGFQLVLRLVDNIRSRGLMTKRNKTASVITREWVHVYSKP